MPREIVDLKLLVEKIKSGLIEKDRPLLAYGKDKETFYVFQDSGLNMLLGLPGSGKTKFITGVIIELLKGVGNNCNRYSNYEIVLIDTERPESQYAFTIQEIMNKCGISEEEVCDGLKFMSTIDLNGPETKAVLKDYMERNLERKKIIVIDHALSLVTNMNVLEETTEVDLLFKKYISDGHIIIISMHSTYSGVQKGLGHLGSAFDRGASFILEIVNSENEDGFTIKNVKSRIHSKSKKEMTMFKDTDGNIDFTALPRIENFNTKAKNDEKADWVPELVYLFSRATIQTKKELYSMINKHFLYSDDSSSASTYYKKYVSDCITFEGDIVLFTEKGNKYLQKDFF